MASDAAPLRDQPRAGGPSWPWFRKFIRWELAPYPGRINTVARMTLTATVVMIVVVTFRIPNAFLAALFSILLARENLTATWRAGRMIVLAFAAACVYTLLGMMLFRGSPPTHFLWVIASLYLIFFVMRTTSNYAAAAAFAIPVGVTLPLWDSSLPSQVQVEGTLWLVLIIAVGAGITLGAESLYRIFDDSDPLITSVGELLLVVQQVAASLATRHPMPEPLLAKVLQYSMTGTGRLRLMLQRQGLAPADRAQRAALVSLVGRLIDLAANLEGTPLRVSDHDASRFAALSEKVGEIRSEFCASGGISTSRFVFAGQAPSNLPALEEMERTVGLMTEVFQRAEAGEHSQGMSGQSWWKNFFLPDAFQNPEYQRFALAGCLTASLCYVLYNALDWRGIGQTCVITCIVTGLSTIGTSLQARFLRLAGFVAGGLVMGMSAQILILPSLDSIFGFALFFATGTAIAAWFATSSPRLSFFGVQMALSFYIVNLRGAQIETDLTIARDKVIGVLLGILAMGLIFDRFGTKSDAEQLEKLLVRNIRMLAQLAVPRVASVRQVTNAEVVRLRSQINESFAGLESQMDSARFESEFRRRRNADLTECARIQRAQPALRSIYLLELTLLSYRGRPDVESSFTARESHVLNLFLNEFSGELMHVAAWIAHDEGAPVRMGVDSIGVLEETFAGRSSVVNQTITDVCQKLAAALLLLNDAC